MSPRQAAKMIRCSPQHVRWLCRVGKLPHTKQVIDGFPGYQYVITEEAAKACRRDPNKRSTRGQRKG